MAIENDDLTNELDRIALALDTGLGRAPDTYRTAAKLMFRASARIRAHEELGLITEGDLKELKSRIGELERWRDDHEKIEQSFTFP